MLCQEAGKQEDWGEYGQDSWPEQDRGIFHTTECHTWSINWEELFGSHQLLLRDGLGIGQQVLRNCVVHHLFLLGFITLFFIFIIMIIFIIILYKLL